MTAQQQEGAAAHTPASWEELVYVWSHFKCAGLSASAAQASRHAARQFVREEVHRAQAEEWRGTVNEIRTIVRALPPHRVYSPADIVELLAPGHHCKSCEEKHEHEQEEEGAS